MKKLLTIIFCCSSIFAVEKQIIKPQNLRETIAYEVMNGPLQYISTKQRNALVGFHVDTIVVLKTKQKCVWFAPVYTWNKTGFGKTPDPLLFLEAIDTIVNHILLIVGKDQYSKIEWQRRGKKMVITPIIISIFDNDQWILKKEEN
jgi:hypothetical protein